MRIFDKESDRTIKDVYLFLTIKEAEELRDSLSNLIEKPEKLHMHVDDDKYEHQITVSVNTDAVIESYSERFKKVIREDK